MRKNLSLLLLLLIPCVAFTQFTKDYPVQPISFTSVKIQDHFWLPRMETNRKVTIPYDFKKCEETDRISNFEKAAGWKKGKHVGIFFNDSDVFKIMEGAAYSLANHPDPELDAYMDSLIAKVAAAQEKDGYLYTARTIDPENTPAASGPERWSNLNTNHELYNVGHMYEAAVAHFQATGKRNFLDVAIKNADLITNTFGHGKQYGFPGHQEIEIGLVRLYRATGNEKYLETAKYFLDVRGREVDDARYPQKLDHYLQAHKPVTEQNTAVGHAVRATYMYSGMADVAAITGDKTYINAITRIWEDVVSGKIYITGGIGSTRHGEAFGEKYDLPNATAYNETCAAIGNMFWNHRMFLLSGEAKYMDVFERTLYNGFLSGISMKGDEFFYPNPLSSDGIFLFNQGKACRSPWFDCSCCPANIVRFLPSLPGYIYAVKGDELFVNLFIGNKSTIDLAGNKIDFEMKTAYPWDGLVELELTSLKSSTFSIKLRMPGWAGGQPLPSDLYHYNIKDPENLRLLVNGIEVEYTDDKGYMTIERKWRKGDKISLNVPMKVKKVFAHEQVVENKGMIALERGPLVYCAESVDNGGNVFNLLVPEQSHFEIKYSANLLMGINEVNGSVPVISLKEDGIHAQTKMQELKAIPYYAWAHRGIGQMTVWFPLKAAELRIIPTIK